MAAAAAAGEQSLLARELKAAAEALLQCGSNQYLFVNECEAYVTRFERALNHLAQQRFADEQHILDGLPNQEQLAAVLVDATRNRPVLKSRVAHARRLLVEGSPRWAAVWRRNPLADVVLGAARRSNPAAAAAPGGPEAPEEAKRPIPFLLELLALGAAALPALGALAGCSCVRHWLLLLLGLLLLCPWVALEVALRCRGRERLLQFLFQGPFVVGARRRELGCLWWPSKVQLLPEEGDDSLGCVSFGHWWRKVVPVAGAEVARAPAAVGPGAQAAAIGDAQQEFHLSYPAGRWAARPVQLEASGAVGGLPQTACFDGGVLSLDPPPAVFARAGAAAETDVWVKAGCRRLDFIYKVVASLALLGLLCLVVAVARPPHLDCSGAGLAPVPLRAVFLLDGSGSIDDAQWASEQSAAKGIIDTFLGVYGGGKGLLHVGLVQFASDATLEVALTDDVSKVTQTLQTGMAQMKSGTDFAKPLSLCQSQLAGYTKAGSDTFDLCVLITDGEDGSGRTPSELMALVSANTAIFGIFVGTSPASRSKLQSLVQCGRATKAGQPCDFFAAADDFKQLQAKAEEVAKAITKRSSQVAGSCTVPPALWCCPLLALPFLAWWVWLLLPARRPEAVAPVAAAPAEPAAPTSAMRLFTAGRNEARDVPLLGASGASGSELRPAGR